jgi:hypothetical protein
MARKDRSLDYPASASANGQFRVETIRARPKLLKNAKVKDVFTPQKNTRSRNMQQRRAML